MPWCHDMSSTYSFMRSACLTTLTCHLSRGYWFWELHNHGIATVMDSPEMSLHHLIFPWPIIGSQWFAQSLPCPFSARALSLSRGDNLAIIFTSWHSDNYQIILITTKLSGTCMTLSLSEWLSLIMIQCHHVSASLLLHDPPRHHFNFHMDDTSPVARS